ncbi:hypothetical protein KR51_00021200 [Rubidibacter lacunae KORDI 51-2]|uniref:Uncharacterized protein n=2 Tax=Rubidibacter TaxID=582491 RepID=U5DK75_9CHRO|nr:hypothetical protein KR51_00021200 [Rubidibacter lacunae KORDI 51-2]
MQVETAAATAATEQRERHFGSILADNGDAATGTGRTLTTYNLRPAMVKCGNLWGYGYQDRGT